MLRIGYVTKVCARTDAISSIIFSCRARKSYCCISREASFRFWRLPRLVFIRWHITCSFLLGSCGLMPWLTLQKSVISEYLVEAIMARQDDQQSNANAGGNNQRQSAGGRGTPGDYSDPNAKLGQGSGKGSQGQGGDRNQIANDDDDDDQTYGRQAYQADAGGRSTQGGSAGRSASSRSDEDEGSGSMRRSAQGGIQSGSQLGEGRQQQGGGNQGRSGQGGGSQGRSGQGSSSPGRSQRDDE